MQGLVGQTIGRYQITEHLGRGGMAEVYKAYQPSLDRYVAIKVMHTFLADDKDFLTRFEREAKVVATLRHPNIVQVHDFDVQNGQYYMVMEYIDGVTLKSMLESMQERGDWMSLNDTALVILSVGSALKYAHDRKMVHRDVKPANVMIASDGHVILTDFGIAKIMTATNLTASGAMVGTPSYMSPEQGMGQPGDERSDIYSLGVMLYQLAVGRLPYDADTPLAVVLKHINDPLPIPRAVKPDLPEDVERVILKALAKNPEDRYQNASELLADLKRAMGMAADITPTDMIKPGSVIKLSSATVVGRIGAVTPPIAGAPSDTGRLGAASTVARAGAPGAVVGPRGTAEAVAEPALPVAGRPKWLIPVIILGLLVLAGGGVALVASGGATPPTPTPTATLPPTAASTSTPTEFVGTLTQDGVECRDSAAPSSGVRGTINKDDAGEFTVSSRSGDLLQIELRGIGSCWVPVGAVDLGDVDISSIPAAASLATLTPTPTLTPAPTETPSPTPAATNTNTPGPTRPPATRPPAPPTQPPPPTAPAATPTGATQPLNWGFQHDFCTYDGSNYTCNVTIWGSGGDGKYHFALENVDTGLWEEKTGGQATYLVRSRRCRVRVQQVRIWDESGNHIEPNLTTDPAVLGHLFPGGACTES